MRKQIQNFDVEVAGNKSTVLINDQHFTLDECLSAFQLAREQVGDGDELARQAMIEGASFDEAAKIKEEADSKGKDALRFIKAGSVLAAVIYGRAGKRGE